MSTKSQHPFRSHTVHFATMHGKEKILAPLFEEAGMRCVVAFIDTDKFGTFSGEVERVGGVRDNLRKKISAAAATNKDARFILASEGSFVPHPLIGLFQTDLESLLLFDRETGCEIYAEHLSSNPVHVEKALGPRDDFRAALREMGFPEHSVIVRPETSCQPMFKGLKNERDVAQAMIDCFSASQTAKVILATDLRADQNPTRRLAIYEAGKSLIDSFNSLCPSCSYPGFSIVEGVPGLPCSECGAKSRAARAVVFACPKCQQTEERSRADGLRAIDSSECEFCNP